MANNNGKLATEKTGPAAGGVTIDDELIRQLVTLTGCWAEHARIAVDLLHEIGLRKRAQVEAAQNFEALTLRDRCCGHEWTNSAGSVYVHHALNDDCPIHGEAPFAADRGLRSYVERKPENIAAARAAIENWALWVDARATLDEARRDFDRVCFDMSQIGARQRRLF